jgi:para-aminobenzoate synthetase/4-amino-4-deoxychorismate lyase
VYLPAASGRFDDLRSGTCQAFPDIAFDLVAMRPEHVASVLAEVQRATADGLWAFGFLSYEAAAALDHGLAVHEPVLGLPLAWFGVSAAPKAGPALRPAGADRYRAGRWSLEWGFERYRERMEAVRELIAAGEIYQCNLSTRLTGEVGGDLFAFYADLALGQGGEFNAYLDLGQFVIASASPELFFEIRDHRVHTRPMKGTAPRGGTPAEDAALLAQLGTSPKERAENTMIVDLVRNDIARIASSGSVRVESLCRPETYETVHQLTSEISARLGPQIELVDVFRALFPCGSVTGAPKRRTMQFIRDLETGPRGVYCGAIGWVAPESSRVRARFNVAIRTALITTDSGMATYGTGVVSHGVPVPLPNSLNSRTRRPYWSGAAPQPSFCSRCLFPVACTRRAN